MSSLNMLESCSVAGFVVYIYVPYAVEIELGWSCDPVITKLSKYLEIF